MPKYSRRVIAPLGIILMIGVATTERLAAQSIFESCETDLKAYCGQETRSQNHTSRRAQNHTSGHQDNHLAGPLRVASPLSLLWRRLL